MMHFNTGHSTVFPHCKTEGCLYHAAEDSEYCQKCTDEKGDENDRI